MDKSFYKVTESKNSRQYLGKNCVTATEYSMSYVFMKTKCEIKHTQFNCLNYINHMQQRINIISNVLFIYVTLPLICLAHILCMERDLM